MGPKVAAAAHEMVFRRAESVRVLLFADAVILKWKRGGKKKPTNI